MGRHDDKLNDKITEYVSHLLVTLAACSVEAPLYGKPHAGFTGPDMAGIKDGAKSERFVAMMTECTWQLGSGCQVKHHCWVILPYSRWS